MTSSVVICTWGEGRDGVPSESEEVLTLGRKVSTSLQVELNWLVLGPMPVRALEVAGSYGVANLDRADDAKLADFQPDPWVEALAQYCAEHPTKALLFGQSFDARLIAPRLAGRLGTGVVMNGVDVDVAEDGRLQITASAYGGDTRVVYELAGVESCVVSVLANAVLPEPRAGEGPDPTLRDIQVDLSGVEERVRTIEGAQTDGPRLEDAEIIVSGGRGLSAPADYELVEQLAKALGGMAGASRPLVDDGWVDSSRQVGLTGKITRPALYVAAGISGASQHMAGCSAAKTIVAINRDPDAAIFRYARYGIVGDCLEILPELIRAVKER
jgi:electron transfer flavoprotein alpha subunit